MAKKPKEEPAKKRLPWIRVNLSAKGGIDAASDKQAGRAFKMAMQYAYQAEEGLSEIEASLPDEMTKLVFSLLRQGVDESREAHIASVEGGKKGAAERWKNEREKMRQELIEELYQQNGGDEATPNSDLLKKYRGGKGGLGEVSIPNPTLP